MTSASSRLATGLALVTTLLVQQGAAAQPADPGAAERLYEEGSSLLRAGDLARACPMLDESQRLDPTAGGALALALCREREGKLASAVVAYDAAVRLARGAGDTERASAAEARVRELRSRVPRVEVTLAASLRSRGPFVVVLDGAVVGGALATTTTIELDAGRHVLEARAGELATVATPFDARDGATAAVELTARESPAVEPAPLPEAPAPVRPAPVPSEGTWSTTRYLGLGFMGIGVVAVGTGVAFAASGSGDADELERLGYDGARGTCRVSLASCQDSFDAATTAADLSTALFISGGAMMVLGTTLLLWGGSEPDSSPSVAVSATPTSAWLQGRY